MVTEPAAGPRELEFVEAVAVQLEQQGLLRMSGRAMGWLLICDPADQSLTEIAHALQVSAGALSSALRHLVPSGLVERSSRPGERRDRFRISPGAWAEHASVQAARYAEFRRITERGLRLLADQPCSRSRRLRETHDFYAWLERQMPPLWSRWEQQKKERSHDPCGDDRRAE